MMSDKRFEIIGEKYIGHMQGNAFVISNTEGFCIFIKEKGKEKTKDSWLLQKEIDELSNENRHLIIENEILEENEEEFFELKGKYGKLEKENEQLKTEVEHLKSHYEHQCKKLAKENDKLKETLNRLEEAIEKRGYEDITDFW